MVRGDTGFAVGAAALSHAAVDACCALLLFGAVSDGRLGASQVLPAYLAYGLLAFGTQSFLGFAADVTRSYGRMAVWGALVVAGGLALALVPGALPVAVVVAGLGNAAFHVGAGVLSLKATPGKALAPGLFVAPGAAGLALGTFAGRAGEAPWLFLAVLLASTIVLAWSFARPEVRHVFSTDSPAPSVAPHAGLVTLLVLVLVVVCVRSFVGMAVAFPWAGEPLMLLARVCAVVAGKALGGVLADRFGRRQAGVASLLVAAAALPVGTQFPPIGLLGLLAFNITMPITLVALADAVPGYPGTAFGLTCVALIAGAFPRLVGLPLSALPPWVVPGLVALSAGLLAFSVTRLEGRPIWRLGGYRADTEGSTA